MRLLIHGINYAPECVGIGRYTGEMGAWLAGRGHQVTVLCGPPYYPEWRVDQSYQGLNWRRERLEGVEVLRAPLYVPARVTGKSRMLHELSFAASCLRWWPHLWRRRWDAVLAVCPLTQSGIIPALLSQAQKIPFLFHLQDLQVDMARELGLLKNPTMLALVERVEAWILQRARLVTTISEGMAARLRVKGVPPSRLHLLPNWADLEHIRPAPRHNAMRRELGLTSETVVLYAGNMGEKQGLEVVLEAAALTRENPVIRYLLAGEGAARGRLKSQAADLGLDNLLFLPLQSASRFPLLLAAADIHLVVQRRLAADLVMPSKLANIMAAGRPFIATATAATELGRVTAESQAGLLVPPEDAGALAQAVLRLTTEAGLRKKMAAQARQYAEAFWDREQILRQWEELVLGLVKKMNQYGAKRPEH